MTMVMVKACLICRERPVHTKGRCSRCYEYWKQHGRREERPPWLRAGVTLCITCGERRPSVTQRCARCHRWFRRYGEERPGTVKPRGTGHVTPRRCRNGCEREAIARGRCSACVRYWYRNGKDRPIRSG